MKFRSKLLIVFALTVLSATGLLAWGVTQYVRQEFEASDHQRSEALAAQFQRDFALRGEEVANRVEDIANAEGTLRMALDLGRPQADVSLYAADARGLTTTYRLDYLELVANGVLISSAQNPAQIGNRSDWVAAESGWNQSVAFLRPVDLPDGPQLALVAVRNVHVGASDLYIIGGRRVDANFLRAFVPPAGMRVILYSNPERSSDPAAHPEKIISRDGPVDQAQRFAPLLASATAQPGETEGTIQWSDDTASAEHFLAIPLTGRQSEPLGVLLVGSEEGQYATLAGQIRELALAIAAGALLVCMFLSWWVAARVTRPLARLENAARSIGDGPTAEGKSAQLLPARSRDEVGCASRAFNAMAGKLSERSRESQEVERVAAWREVARRLAHEIKERLFPLQVAVENLRRSREQGPEQFGESVLESVATLTSELEKLKVTVARFSNFAKMPAPRLQPLNVNDSLRAAVKAFEPQFSAIGRPPVTPELFLNERVDCIAADAALLSKALESLLYRSLESMPAGGTLTIRTAQDGGTVRVEVSDTGVGITPEERARLFTPYYAVGVQSSGLGLATVQSVVTGHGGRIAVESVAGSGTMFRIEFPAAPEIAEPGMAESALRAAGLRESGLRESRRPAGQPVVPPVQRTTPKSTERESETLISLKINS